MSWFLGDACLFEEGPPEELAGSFPILLDAMIALTLVDLVGVVVKVRFYGGFWVEKVGLVMGVGTKGVSQVTY